MQLRSSQIAALARARGMHAFRAAMREHVRTFSRRHSRLLGVDGIDRTIDLGIERARAYELTNPGLLRLYVELMFMYGSFFDVDPCLPWAASVLREPGLSEAARATRLYEHMSAWYDAVSGDHLERDREALIRWEEVSARCDVPGLDAPELEAALRAAHPARAAQLTDPLRALAASARVDAARLGIRGERGAGLVAFLRYTKGAGVFDDPALPWARAALAAPELERAAELERSFRAFREAVLAPIED